MSLTPLHLEFMRERVARTHEGWEGTHQKLITMRERIYADFGLLRAASVTCLPIKTWKAFLDRRWKQFVDLGFTMTPSASSPWSDYWKKRATASVLRFHTSRPVYCERAASTTKQKLRELAEKAHASDLVL
jgi:hypothetical protein